MMGEFMFFTQIAGSLVCVVVAALLAWRRVEHWGWFLFLAWIAWPNTQPFISVKTEAPAATSEPRP